MKRLNRPAVLASLALALGAGACDLDLTGLNENPNAPTDVPASGILPQGIISAASLALGYNLNLDLTELWVQHIAEIQYGEEDRYQLRSTEVDASFRGFYSGPLMDFERIIQKGQEAGDPNVTAVGMIMQAWTFQVMTDMWGDLPYFEALQGESEEQNIQPAYTPQAEIYADLLQQLTDASEMIEAGSSPFGSEDLLYGGDMENWRKFANSLRLRIAMRLSDIAPATAQAEAAAAVAAGVFESNADNAMLVYLPALPNVNPWYDAFRLRPGDFRVSATLINALQALDDPRLPFYANPTEATGAFRGMPNGLEEHSFQLNETSTVGPAMGAPASPAVLMSYAEVLFLMAEAAQRNWITGDPAALYRQAITASMRFYGIPESEIQLYLLQPEVMYDAANWRQSIGTQKWLALFGNGPEAFAEWRRLGFPVLTPGRDAVRNVVPYRYPYPDSEYIYNEENLQAAIGRQGGTDLWDGRVWWDVQ